MCKLILWYGVIAEQYQANREDELKQQKWNANND